MNVCNLVREAGTVIVRWKDNIKIIGRKFVMRIGVDGIDRESCAVLGRVTGELMNW
jgi:hypothetical protein